MKIMKYLIPMEAGLTDNYVISNANTDDVCLEDGNVNNPGIKMTIKGCNDLDALFSCFTYDVSSEENLNFRRYYMLALQGQKTPWKLVAIKIIDGMMWMTFCNKKLYTNYYKKVEKSPECSLDNLPYYRENVVFSIDDAAGWLHADIHFMLHRPHCSKIEIVQVHFSKDARTSITELNPSRKRVIYLPVEKATVANEEKRRLATVYEYYW